MLTSNLVYFTRLPRPFSTAKSTLDFKWSNILIMTEISNSRMQSLILLQKKLLQAFGSVAQRFLVRLTKFFFCWKAEYCRFPMRYNTTLRYVWFRNSRLLFKRKISQKNRKITEKTGKQQFQTGACHSLTRHFSESCCTSLERYNTQLFSKKSFLSIGPETSALQSRTRVAFF